MTDPSADDLDQLLDSALDDFSTIDFARASGALDDFSTIDFARASGALDDFSAIDFARAQRSGADGSGRERRDPWLPSSASPSEVQGMGMGLPELGTRRKRKQRAQSKGSHASEALEKLTQQTHEAMRALESATGGTMPKGEGEMVEELIEQFQELAASQDMESMVETIMQQLLSKEILHEPMKEIGGRYPKWLEEHKSVLSQEEYDRYHCQYEFILKLNDVYENEPENFSKIADVMQKMQECGQPPSDIIQELAPDLGLSNLG